ncbi:MAG: FliM/FliN family flagellar motor C-terminal domain-containing protein, partial [Patescibacteria group bacterium]|nr:FliM/FliN family flagellar motor C-terminal domain-containing protein [Patescibacteria group bacterium]
VADGAAMMSFPFTAGDGRRGVGRMVWPAPKPEELAKVAAPAVEPVAVAEPAPAPAAKKPGASVPPAPKGRTTSVRELPIYSRSLLRVKVPVVVTLAEKRQPVSRIVELGPGCIIQFDKSCEEMLDLHLGDRLIANGEAVKVGDKFGLRITNVVLPEERFYPLKKQS